MRFLLVLLTLVALIPIWVTPILPLQDLPNHLLKVHIFRQYLQGDPEVRSIYALNLRPLSNYTFYAFTFLLAPVVGLSAAAKVFVSLYLVALPTCAYFWLRRLSPAHSILALAVPALSYNLFLAKGNLNFCTALAIYMAALALLVGEARGLRSVFLFMVLATLLYFTHGFVFLALVGVVVCLLIIDNSAAPFAKAAGLIPGVFCLVTLIVGQSGTGSGTHALEPTFERPGWYLIRDAFVWLFMPHGWAYDSWLAAMWVAVLGCCGVYTLACILSGIRAGLGFERALRENKWVVVAAALWVAWVLAPVRVAEWAHLQVRLIPLAAVTTLGALRMPPMQAFRGLAMAVFVMTALLVDFRNAQEYGRGSTLVSEYVSGVKFIQPHASLLALDQDEREGDVRFNLHSWAYYHIAKGGWGPYLHAYPSYMPVIYRTTPWGPEELLRGIISSATLERAAACYDYLLVWNPKGPSSSQDARVRRHFDLVYATRSLQVWQNRAGLRKSPPEESTACLRKPRNPATAHRDSEPQNVAKWRRERSDVSPVRQVPRSAEESSSRSRLSANA